MFSLLDFNLGAVAVATVTSQWCAVVAAEPNFRPHTADRIGSKLGQTALVDLKRDSNLDIVFKP